MSRLIASMSLSAWIVVGCASDDPEPTATVEVDGALDVSSDDPHAWTGTEHAAVLDAQGRVVCEEDVPLAAREQLRTCAGCVLTLAVDPVDRTCPIDDLEVSADGRYLGVLASSEGVETWIDLADALEGPWAHVGRGSMADGALTWDGALDLFDTDASALAPADPALGRSERPTSP